MRFLVLLLATGAWGQDTPFFPRATDKDQDMGSINQNFRDLADRKRDEVGGAATPGDTCFDNPTLCIDATNHRVNVGAGGIQFSDGSTQTTAISTASAMVSSSSYVTVTNTNLTLSVMGPCVTGSTVTLNCTSGKYRVCYTGTAESQSAVELVLGYLRNGGFGPAQSATVGIAAELVPADSPANFSFCDPIDVSGQQTFCLTGAQSSGSTMEVPGDNGTFDVPGKFGVECR